MAVSAARNAQLPRYVENRHIDHIPAGARHGKPWHQFAFWFGSNVNVFNVVVGAVIVSIGLTFWPALIAIAVGTLIGALLIALHATQGPRASGTEWALGTEARCRALLSDDESLYRESVERLARSRAAVELARSRLLYGEWLPPNSRGPRPLRPARRATASAAGVRRSPGRGLPR